MANQKNKKTKEEFADLILGMDQADTRVINEDKAKSASLSNDTVKISKSSEPVKAEPVKLQQVKLEPLKIQPKIESAKEESLKHEQKLESKQEAKAAYNVNYDSSMISVEAALKQAELLRLSQNKIIELEKRNLELTQENEALSSSAMVLQRKNDQLTLKLDEAKSELKTKDQDIKEEIAEKEKIIQQLKKDLERIDYKYQELQTLTSEKFHSARRREKELLNRLEILQQEDDVVFTNKDERILSLKKEIDKYQYEVESLKEQVLEAHIRMKDYKDQVKRSLKALKLASSLLESSEKEEDIFKKTGT